MLDFIGNWSEVARQTKATVQALKDGVIDDLVGMKRLKQALLGFSLETACWSS